MTPILETRPRLYMTRDLRDVVLEIDSATHGCLKRVEKFEKKVCGKGKPLSEVWEHGSLLRGAGERERGKGGGGRYPGFDVPFRPVEDGPEERE